MTQIGYITLALNSRAYCELVHNLAASIRAAEWETPIAVVTNRGARFRNYRDAFDKVIDVDGTNANQLKTQIYKLSPFKQTFFVDADSMFLWTRHKLKAFEDRIKESDYCFPVLGRFTKSQAKKAPVSWVNLEQLWEHYGLRDDAVYPALDSSLFYFRKGRKASAFFRKAEKLYGDYPHLKPGHPVKNFPDEVAFSTAAALLSPEFGALDGLTYRAIPNTCNRTAALSKPWLSMPGNPSRGHQQFYNALVKNCQHYVGMGYPFRKK